MIGESVAVLHHADCLEVLPRLPAASVDLVLCDLPYGTTSNKWDSVLPLDVLWQEYLRVGTPNAAFVLTASQPFTSLLVVSQMELFRHEWVWIKNAGSNFANTVREPMKEHESVLVFSRGKWTYNKQMQERTGGGLERAKTPVTFKAGSDNYREFSREETKNIGELRVPSSWQKFNRERGLHPTQKPVPLFEYLVRTYSNPGDTVLDNCMGSGTTGVACAKLGRNFIGVERDAAYFRTANERISSVTETVYVSAP